MMNSDTYSTEEDRAASLFIAFGRKNGALTMVQGQRRIIDDFDEGVDFVLSDDTGMDSYDFNAPNEAFPLSLSISADGAPKTSPAGLRTF